MNLSEEEQKLVILKGLKNTASPHAPPRSLRTAVTSTLEKNGIEFDYKEKYNNFMGTLKSLHQDGLIRHGSGNYRSSWSITKKGLELLEEHRDKIEDIGGD